VLCCASKAKTTEKVILIVKILQELISDLSSMLF
jgi:hypothetical protein